VREEYGARQSPQLNDNLPSQGPPLIAATDEIRAYRRGEACREKKDYDKAITEFTEALRVNPQYAAAFKERGRTYLEKKDYDKAIAGSTVALRLDPRSAQAYSDRGNAWRAKKE